MPSRPALLAVGQVLLVMTAINIPPLAIVLFLRWLAHRNDHLYERALRQPASIVYYSFHPEIGTNTDHDRGRW